MNRLKTPAHKGIVIALLPFSTAAMLAKLDADDRAQAIPATRLTGIGYDEASGSVQLAWINPEIALEDGKTSVEIDIDGNGYKPGINNVLLLDGACTLLIEDAQLSIEDGMKLAEAVLPLIIDADKRAILGSDDDTVAGMPTHVAVTDRARYVKADGSSIAFALDNVGERLTASIALDEVTGSEYAVIAGEGSSEVYAAQSSILAQANTEDDAAESFVKIGEVDGKIARLAKPDDGKIEVTYTDGRTALIGIEDGKLKIEAKGNDKALTDQAETDVTKAIEDEAAPIEASADSDPGSEKVDQDIDAGTSHAAKPDDVVGNQINPWELIGLTGAVTDADGIYTRASVQTTPAGGMKLRFEKQEVQAAA